MGSQQSRRKLLKASAMALVMARLANIGQQSHAASNAALRAEYQYRDYPEAEKNCANCLEFIPGQTAKAPGRCKRIPGDDEILPSGYCRLWNTM